MECRNGPNKTPDGTKKQTTPSNTTKQDIINDLDECRDTIASFIAKSTVEDQAKWGNLPDN